MTYRLVVALIAKGSMNNLHRIEIVDAFRQKGIMLSFLVRHDYFKDISRLKGCDYLTCRIIEPAGRKRIWINRCRHIRHLYSAGGLGLIPAPDEGAGFARKITQAILKRIGQYQWVGRLAVKLENQFMRDVEVEGLDHSEVDQLLLLGIGTHGSENEAALTFWARRHGLSVVHMIANYDHLTSKGYRGFPVDNLLVWGERMKDDAAEVHGIGRECITTIGSIRYNLTIARKHFGRNEFLRRIGLDPRKKTILFAGGMAEFHYFEMLQLFENLNESGSDYQMILRVYPDKSFMRGPYVKPLLSFCLSTPDIYASVADPNYRFGIVNEEVPQIEEDELVHSLQHCDVVINLLSTIALEACMFDKPIVYMLYYPTKGYAWQRPPQYIDYPKLLHNQRMLDYGLAEVARSREELRQAIELSIANPGTRQLQRKLAVARELGELDGKACERLVTACVAAFDKHITKDMLANKKFTSMDTEGQIFQKH